MAAQTEAGKVISETAKAEGGPEKGSLSAQMQSQVGKQRNFEQAAQEVGGKMQSNPENVTSERLAAVNEGDAKLPSKGQMDSATRSATDRVENFQAAAENVAPKMANAPEAVTKEEADLLHSREQRAFGETSKGGIASQAQSMAAENEKKGTI